MTLDSYFVVIPRLCGNSHVGAELLDELVHGRARDGEVIVSRRPGKRRIVVHRVLQQQLKPNKTFFDDILEILGA